MYGTQTYVGRNSLPGTSWDRKSAVLKNAKIYSLFCVFSKTLQSNMLYSKIIFLKIKSIFSKSENKDDSPANYLGKNLRNLDKVMVLVMKICIKT